MIKKLRIKFISIVMAIVMLMVGGILGVVIRFTATSMEVQSINMMRAIAARPMQQRDPGKLPNGEVRLPFFTVQINLNGALIVDDGGYFDLSDKAYIQQIVNEALRTEDETGKLEAHDLRYLKTDFRHGTTIVFADTTTESATLRNLLYSCLVIFLGTMVAFLGISVLLSQWAIKPVARAWNQQRQFVADASHELKTPLSVIMANAELMQNEDATEDDRVKYAANILNMSYQMRSLVQNMLEMARVDNGTLKMQLVELDFSQLVCDAVLSFQLLFEEKGLALQHEIQEGIQLHGSEQHLYQIMDVLLDNALKYSAPNGTVRVNLQITGRNCVLSVSSEGEAISRDDLKNIFKRFYRVDKARVMNGSYGLGLAIAEAVVEAHKGRIWAESAQGCNTFFVQLPVGSSSVKFN